MKKQLFKLSGLFLLIFMIAFSSCKKDDADTQSAEDAAKQNRVMGDAFAMAGEASTGGKLLKAFQSAECYTVEIADGYILLIFNECTDEYGIYHNGTIKVSAAADAWTGGTSGGITIEFIEYTNGNETIDGTMTAQYTIDNLSFYYSVSVTNFSVTYASGQTTTLTEASLKFKLSLTSLANGFVISGTCSGTNRFGVNYTTISENITYKLCPWPTEGTITVKIEGEPDIIVDFDQDGKGACDNKILVSQKKHKDVVVTLD